MHVKPEHWLQHDQWLSGDSSQPTYSDRSWLHNQTDREDVIAQKRGNGLPDFAGIIIMAVIVVTALSSCTMVSKEMLPGLEYRENPTVEIIEYDDYAKLQEDCIRQHKKAAWRYSGCSLVPHDATQKCIIRIMAGDEKTKKHELAHCHGHADTFLPWMVDFDFYGKHGEQR